MDAVKWYFRGFNRLVGEIGVRGPPRRRESQGCDRALTNSGSLKLHAPPWTLRGLSLNGPVPSASPQRRSPPRVFQPRHDPSARYLVKLRLSALSTVFRGQDGTCHGRLLHKQPRPMPRTEIALCKISQRPVIVAGSAIDGIWFTRLKVVMRCR